MDNKLLECQHMHHSTTALNNVVNSSDQSKRLKTQELITLNTNTVTCGCLLCNNEHILKLKKPYSKLNGEWLL